MRLTPIHCWGISGGSRGGGYSGGSVGGGHGSSQGAGPGGSVGTGQDAKDRAMTRSQMARAQSRAQAAARQRQQQDLLNRIERQSAQPSRATVGTGKTGTGGGGYHTRGFFGGTKQTSQSRAMERDTAARALKAAGLTAKPYEKMTAWEKTKQNLKIASMAANPTMGLLKGLGKFGSEFLGPIFDDISASFKQSLADNAKYGWNPFDKEGFARRMADPAARARYEQMMASTQESRTGIDARGNPVGGPDGPTALPYGRDMSGTYAGYAGGGGGGGGSGGAPGAAIAAEWEGTIRDTGPKFFGSRETGMRWLDEARKANTRIPGGKVMV